MGSTHTEPFSLRVQHPSIGSNTNKTAYAVVKGHAVSGNTLHAKIHDRDGVPEKGLSYQWYADSRAIAGAKSATYQITPAEQGKQISVQIGYTDLAGNSENVMSKATVHVSATMPLQPAKPNYFYLGDSIAHGYRYYNRAV